MRIEDKLSGKFTCKGLSTVHYFLCDYSIFKFVSNMQVLEHSKLFSDVHTPIVLYLVLPENSNVFLPKLLDSDREKIFLESIDSDQLYELLISLDNTCSNMKNTTEGDIDEIVAKLNKIYIDAAKISLGTSKPSRGNIKMSKLSNNSKPWFNNVCQKARTKYRNSKVYYFRKRTEGAYKKYKEHETSYQKTLDKEQVKHRNKVSTYLKEIKIKTKNPKEYWKIINKHTKNKKGQELSGIDINVLYQYFRDLNRCPEISYEINLAIDNDIATYKMQCEDLNQTFN